MKGDGEGESEGARENDYGKLNNDIKVSRRGFIKTTAAFGAAVAGIPPYNLMNIGDIVLKEDGELVMHPLIYEFKFEFASKHKRPFKHMIGIKPWGCNWNCRWCPTKFYPRTDMIPIRISIDQIVDYLLNLDDDTETMLAITGGEPLLQEEEVLKLIKSLKTETNYTVMLVTNGSLIEGDFINKANNLGLDGIDISFYSLDDKFHRWYTGHSNEDTIKALELVTKKFKGLAVVSMVLFSDRDMITFENMCEFLHEINPDFLIKIFCPYHERKECMKGGKRHEAEEIALHYFKRMDRSFYFSTQIKYIKYLIEEDESGGMGIIKSREWARIKKEGEF